VNRTGSGRARARLAPQAAPEAAQRDDGQRPDGHPWRVLAIVLVGSFMAVLDTTIVNVALVSIGTGVHASPAALEWVVSGYALTFGLALVPAGRLGDRYGYKRLFLTGLVIFTLASAACGFSRSPAELIISRLVQGLGAGIYYPAISATIQRLFGGRERSRAFGYLGGTVGVSTAAGPLLGGVLIQLGGVQSGWRWVFLVNLFIGAAEIPAAIKLMPRRHHREAHGLDPAGNVLLAAVLILLLIPLVEGRSAGWPWWSWLCVGGSAVLALILARWEIALSRRGGEPVIRPDLMRHRSFTMGQLLALCYFAGFTSLFFILSILWQEGLGRSALATGFLVVPFALASLVTASNSDRFSTRIGRTAILAGAAAMLAGQTLVLLVIHIGAPSPSAWLLAGPLVLAGAGNGLVIAPNQDFVLGSVPRREAGTAGAALIAAQRIGAAIGIAAIGTALFGSGHSGNSGNIMPQFVHTAQGALLVGLGFIAVALCCGLALPRSLSEDRARENA
jgi:EmrB/QacA subfamily drug resistance transporter